ncbi:MAG TPA: DUF2141 domain-containing protein [Allosphingosinicella sp.]
MFQRIGSASLAALLPALALASGAPAPAFAQAACGGPAGRARIWINVDRVRDSNGLIAVTVYPDNPRKFLAKRGALYVVRVPAKQGRTRVCVNLPSTGVYGFGIYHDMDGDRGFDRTGLGLPAEAYGFSNNPAVIFGLPSFSSVRLNVPRTNMWTTIRLKYPQGPKQNRA